MRVKRGVSAHKKHKKLLKGVKGYRTSYSKLIKRAKEATLHAGQYALAGRRKKTGDYRRLWITRINAALREKNMRYSDFMNKLSKSNMKLNRKVLADLAVNHTTVFNELVAKFS